MKKKLLSVLRAVFQSMPEGRKQMENGCTQTETYSERDTFDYAAKLAKEARPGGLYLLSGDLGTGKTVFAKGFAEGLGVTDCVNSPTFTIMQTYESGRIPFYHFDVYRISDCSEMYELGYEEYFFGNGVCLVEWAELISELLPDDAVYIRIEKDMDKGFDYRKITVTKGNVI